jgi:putative transcriptional regulator
MGPRKPKRSDAARRSRDFLAGKLLIAMPNMRDPRFERSVILLVEHDDEHAMGVIVNKPLADVELGELLEQLDIDPREGIGGDPVFFGGPVRTERGLVLHTADYDLETTVKICPGVSLTTAREILTDVGGRAPTRARPEKYIVAIGYAGWGAGQLEAEFAVNAWIHSNLDLGLVFSDEPSQTWNRALRNLGVTGAMLSPEWATPRPDDAPLN